LFDNETLIGGENPPTKQTEKLRAPDQQRVGFQILFVVDRASLPQYPVSRALVEIGIIAFNLFD
jgi:hypothetical protein